jgi:hypothetical protein
MSYEPQEKVVSWLKEMFLQARQNAWSAVSQALQAALVLALAAILDHPRVLRALEHLTGGTLNLELLWVTRWSFIVAALVYLAVLAFFFISSIFHMRAVRALLHSASLENP